MSAELHVDWQDFILQEVAEKNSTRKQIAQTYSYLIQGGHKDWHTVNAAIKERFGAIGLQRIKERAWLSIQQARF